MNTLRLYIAALGILQALIYPTGEFLGTGWSLVLSIVSTSIALFAVRTTTADLTEPHPAQRVDSYRVAAQRSEEATVRVVRPKRRVLKAEYEEARSASLGWSFALSTMVLFAALAGTVLYVGEQWALVPTILLTIGAVVCIGGFIWSNRIVRAWRDQERGER